MNLTRCAQGHFYDGEKYPSCPHCGEAEGMMDTPTEMFTESAEMLTQPAPQPMAAPVPDYQPDNTLPIGGVSADSVTLPFGGVSADSVTVPIGGVSADSVTVPLSGNFEAGVTEPWNPTPQPQQQEADDDDDHTLAFFDYDEKTFDAPQPAAPAAPAAPVPEPQQPKVHNKTFSGPCVGWMVAIGGSHIGQDFHLKTGKNFIGRDESMDIALTGDRSVSREKQAIIIYEPKQHLYLIQPGEASSLVYCNNEVVLNPVALKAYDMITVGDVNLIFIPLCGQQFNWNDILLHKKEN